MAKDDLTAFELAMLNAGIDRESVPKGAPAPAPKPARPTPPPAPKPAPPPAEAPAVRQPDGPNLFFKAMDAVGVRPQGGHAPRPSVPARAQAPAPAPVQVPASPPPPDLAPQVAALEAELAAALARADAAEAGLAKAQQAVTKEEDALSELRRRLKSAEAERDTFDGERRALARKLGEHAPAAPRSDAATLAELLRERGCQTVDEAATVLSGLARHRPRELAEALPLSAPEAARAILDDRVAFLCKADTTDVVPRTVVIQVQPARCEVCGGSDIRRGYKAFAAACKQAGVRRVAIVGGSPNYRRQLATLAHELHDGPVVNTASGTKDLGRRGAEQIMNGNDLVLIWGGTILDHSVSEVFHGDACRVVTIAHRGISVMLKKAAALLSA